MRKLKLITAIAIVVSAATMLFPAKTMAAQGTSTSVCTPGSTPNSCLVKISLVDGKVDVDPDSQSIVKSKNQTVEWECVNTDPCVWTVVFKGKGPFKNGFFYNSHANSGTANVPANPNVPYKYSVIVNGKHEKDPQIIIK